MLIFMHRLYSFHRFDRAMAGLTGQAGIDMRTMGEAYEVGQRVDPVPANFEIGLRGIGPGTSHRQQSAVLLAAVASHAALHGRHARGRGTPRVLVAILAGNLIDPGVNAMAKGDGLLNVVARSPRPLRESDHGDPAGEHHQRQREQSAVQIQVHFRSGGTRTLPPLSCAARPGPRRAPETIACAAPRSHTGSTGLAAHFILKLSGLMQTRITKPQTAR